MKARRANAWLSLAVLCLGAGPGQAPALTGRVLLEFQGQKPVHLVKVTLQGLNPTRTDSEGVFVLSMRPGTQAGERIKLEIDKPGYCILSPFNGEVVVPGDKRPVEVRLLRSESRQGTTQDCLAKFIEGVANKPKNPTRPEQKPEPLDLPHELQAWASRQGIGLTDQQAREELDGWLAAVKSQPRNDPHLLGLARFAEKKFAEARQLFTQAAQEAEKHLARAGEQVVLNYRLAGDSASQESNFEASLAAYQKALEQVSRTEQPNLWAALLRDLSNTHLQLGIRVMPDRTQEHLASAVSSCWLALQVFTRDQQPLDWALTQNNLGNALQEQARRTGGAESLRLMGESVQAYRLALQVQTREQQPLDWASTQHNLGNALQQQGQRARGAESLQLMGESVQAYRLALQVRTQEQRPLDWARTQSNLGAALQEQGQRAGGESLRLLGESVQAYRLALQVFTREQQPQDWARTQNNLGNTLSEQGQRARGAESLRLLGESVQAYRLALQVFTQEQLPQQWALTQNNLGTALLEQGLRASGAESLRLLGESVYALRLTLQVFIREQLAQDWARTQNNLGNALLEQGLRAGGAESPRLLGESVHALRLALQVFTREQLPQQWARTQNNLGNALLEQGLRAGGAESLRLLGESVYALRLALQVFTREQLPRYWAATQNNLGRALCEQGLRAEGAESLRLLSESVHAYRLVLENDPDVEEVFAKAFSLYQNHLGDFDTAYALLESWLQRHPNDVGNQAHFAEARLTTGRFAESAQHLASLLTLSDLASQRIPLKILEVVALTALGNTNELPARMKSLRDTLAAQPKGFEMGWGFAGVKAFLERDVRLASRRTWLLALIAAVENPDRGARLAALDAVIAHQPAAPPG